MKLLQGQALDQAMRHLLLAPTERGLVTPRPQPVVEAYSVVIQLLPQHQRDSVDLGAMPTLVEASSEPPTNLLLERKTIQAAACLEVDLAPTHLDSPRNKPQVDSAIP